MIILHCKCMLFVLIKAYVNRTPKFCIVHMHVFNSSYSCASNPYCAGDQQLECEWIVNSLFHSSENTIDRKRITKEIKSCVRNYLQIANPRRFLPESNFPSQIPTQKSVITKWSQNRPPPQRITQTRLTTAVRWRISDLRSRSGTPFRCGRGTSSSTIALSAGTTLWICASSTYFLILGSFMGVIFYRK